MGRYLAEPYCFDAGFCAPAKRDSQRAQSGHQLPGCSVADAIQSSTLGGNWSLDTDLQPQAETTVQ